MNQPSQKSAPGWAPYLLSVVRIALGFIFIQHGAEKLWGFAGGRIEHNFTTLRGFAGPLEIVGGTLLILGLFTRTTAFILCGEMAVAYFTRWAPRGFWAINNGGEEAVINCYLFLWLVTAGAGPWSLDALFFRGNPSKLRRMVASWEGYGRSIARIILAFTFSLHGFRHLFGLFPRGAGRQQVMMALDTLPAMFGALEIVGAACLLLGLFTRPVAFILCLELAAAYLFGSAPRGPWPIRNGGNEALIYLCAFAYLAATGGGHWSVDQLLSTRRKGAPAEIPAMSSEA
jgi:putative oxidoreductase